MIITLFVLVKREKQTFIINASYFPPNSPATLYLKYAEILDSVLGQYTSSFKCITGDFNFPFLNWDSYFESNDITNLNSNDTSDIILLEAVLFNGLRQINSVKIKTKM